MPVTRVGPNEKIRPVLWNRLADAIDAFPISTGSGLQGYYDVKAYGALGNGVANDTTAIQTAINAAFAVGGTVYFPPGEYIVSAALTTPENVAGAIRLVGGGKPRMFTGGVNGDPTGIQGAEIRTTSTTDDVFRAKTTSGNTRQYLTIENLTFRGNLSGGTTGHGINLVAAGTTFAIITHMQNVTVMGARQNGIMCDGNVMEQSWINVRSTQNGGAGIKTQANTGGLPGELRMFGCHAWTNSGAGLDLAGGGLYSLHGVSVNSNGGAGLLANAVRLSAFDLNFEVNGSSSGDQAVITNCTGPRFYATSMTTKPGSTGTGIRFVGSQSIRLDGLSTDSGAGGAGYMDLHFDDASSRYQIDDYSSNDFVNRIRHSPYGGAVQREGGRWFTGQTRSTSSQSTSVAATITPDARLVDEHRVTVTGAGGIILTMANPLTPLAFGSGQRFTYEIFNNSSGAITCNWGGVFLLAGAWVNPAAGKTRRIEFVWNDSRGFVEQSRSGEI